MPDNKEKKEWTKRKQEYKKAELIEQLYSIGESWIEEIELTDKLKKEKEELEKAIIDLPSYRKLEVVFVVGQSRQSQIINGIQQVLNMHLCGEGGSRQLKKSETISILSFLLALETDSELKINNVSK